MALIVRAYSETDASIAYASSINKVIDDLYTLQAGNIDNSNIAISGINSSNYAQSSIYTDAIKNQAIDFDRLDYESVISMEVFT